MSKDGWPARRMGDYAKPSKIGYSAKATDVVAEERQINLTGKGEKFKVAPGCSGRLVDVVSLT